MSVYDTTHMFDVPVIHAGVPPYNPVSSSPQQAPQARYTSSQSPERASDPLAFLQDPLVAQSQPPRQRTAVATGRKAVKAAYQPYQPPVEGPSLFPPPQQQAKVHIVFLMLPSACHVLVDQVRIECCFCCAQYKN